MSETATNGTIAGLDVSTFMELQQQGANARALGRSPIDNPFYRVEAMPISTGESTELWNAKAEAWGLGFTLEDAMRG